jgi:hypothetical protein
MLVVDESLGVLITEPGTFEPLIACGISILGTPMNADYQDG